MIRYFGLILLPIVMFLSGCQMSHEDAKSGRVTLTDWHPETGSVFALDGEWEFYWEQHISPGYQSDPDAYAIVPHRWKNSKLFGKKLGAFGYASYRLEIETTDRIDELGIIIPYQGSSYRLYINGEIIAQNGDPGTNRASSKNAYRPQTVYFDLTTNHIEMIFHVANFDYGVGGGLWGVPIIGESERIMLITYRQMVLEASILGIFIVLFMYHLSLYIARRKDVTTLYFALICLSFAVRSAFVRGMLPIQLFPSFPWELSVKLNFISMYVGMLMIFLFVDFSFFYNKSYIFRRIAWISTAIISVFTAVTPAMIFTPLLIVEQSVVIVIGVYTIVILVRSLKKDNMEPLIFLIGFGCYMVTGLLDIFYSHRLHQLGYTGQYGLLLLITSQIIVVSMRLSRTYQTAESLSQELEHKVNERTSELELERNRLRDKNRQMNEELRLAQKIQIQLIPSESPSEHVSYYYRPMSEVGGDFFHFVNYADGRLGIFISDVSGHGVPAAFITSIIKSNLLQFADVVKSPSELLIHLNGSLYAQTGGNFVTAFYCIYNPVTCELVFSNAGHNYPYMIGSANIGYLDMISPGVPLAVFSNKELVSRKMVYETQTVYLPVNSKLLLYTDGLSEAVNKEFDKYAQFQSIPDYEKERMSLTLSRLRESTSKELSNGLVEDLIEFRGTEEFDDDICLICLEIV